MKARRSILIALSAALSGEAASPADSAPDRSRIQLRDGQYLTGTIRPNLDSSRLLLEIGSNDTIYIPRKAVGSIHQRTRQDADIDAGTGGDSPDPRRDPPPSGEGWNQDPSFTRGLALPNGFMLKQGQGFFVQNELVISQVGYGVTDWLNVVAGSALPALFVEGGANLLVAGKVGGSIDLLHGSIGWMEMLAPGATVGGPYGGLSIGNDRGNITLSYSHILAPEGSDGSVDWYSFAANLRAGHHVALLGEVWNLRPAGESPQTLLAPGIRLMSGGLSGDLAFVFIKELEVPIPWVNIAYAF